MKKNVLFVLMEATNLSEAFLRFLDQEEPFVYVVL